MCTAYADVWSARDDRPLLVAFHHDPGQYLGPAISAGVPAYFAYRGTQQTNQDNLAIAREQMAFQERMSSTAYQRSTEDMRAAGINPMLAYQQGGASTPGGASATMQSEIGTAVATAQGARRMKAELKAVAADTSLTTEKEWSELQGRAESRSREDLYQRQADLAKLQKKIFELQIPALENSAKVEMSTLGGRAAYLDRLRQTIMGGRGFFNPVGN